MARSSNPSNPSSQPDSENRQVSSQQSKSKVNNTDNCARYDCDRCKQNVRPCPDSLPDWKTHLIAGLIFLIGLPFCIFLPYCCDCFGKKVDRCPKCGAFMTINDSSGNHNHGR